MADPIAKGDYKNPRFQGIIFRRTHKQLNESLIPRAIELYGSVGGQWNGSDYVFKFPSGARIFMSYLETNKDARQHDTAEYQYEGFDELTHFEEFQYLYLTSRCRSTIPGIVARVRSGSNPGNIGHAWVRKRFVEPAPAGFKMIYDPKSKTYRSFIPSLLEDNPHLNEMDPNYRNRLELLPEAERRAKIYGDWWTFAGQVFTEWNPDIHVITPFKIPSWWPKVLCVDWGYEHMLYAGWLAISPLGEIYLYKEYHSKRESVKVWGSNIANWCTYDKNIKLKVLDPSAWAERGLDKTVASQFMEIANFPDVEQADNDRLGGKHLFHDMLRHEARPARWKPPEGYDENNANRILALRGVEAYHEYRKLFDPDEPETVLPRFKTFDTCPKFIETIPLLVYDDSGKVQNKTKAEDVKKMNGDDPYDAVRYGFKGVDRYLLEAAEENKRFQQLSAIHELAKTDMTSFYVKMAEYEENDGDTNVIPFRRIPARRAFGTSS